MPHAQDRRCLIVEDEVVVGMDLEDELQQSGFDVQWVASIEGALAALDQRQIDVAILDVVMRGEPCTALAFELKRRNIPFVVHTGWMRQEQGPAFQHAPWISKPAEVVVLAEALTEALCMSSDSLTQNPDRLDQIRQPLPAQADQGWSENLGSSESGRPFAVPAAHG